MIDVILSAALEACFIAIGKTAYWGLFGFCDRVGAERAHITTKLDAIIVFPSGEERTATWSKEEGAWVWE